MAAALLYYDNADPLEIESVGDSMAPLGSEPMPGLVEFVVRLSESDFREQLNGLDAARNFRIALDDGTQFMFSALSVDVRFDCPSIFDDSRVKEAQIKIQVSSPVREAT